MTIKMRKSLLIGGAIAAIAIVITAIVLSGVIEQEEKLVLSNYPKLFEKEVVIVIGENASRMEYESAEAIASNLENLTGNKPEIINTKKIESFKYSYNLIILGTPNSNEILEAVHNMTDAIRVTEEYPGENKGILEILSNPWNEDKAMLLVEGSDVWGVKAGGEMLEESQKFKSESMIFVNLEEYMEMKFPIQVIFTAEITPECEDRAYVADMAEYIIEGTVEKIKIEHPEGRKTPIKYNNVKIEKYVKGDIKKSEIQIVVDWALLGAIHTQLGEIPDHLYPSFHEGKKVRIYFEKRNDKFFITCSVFGIEKLEKIG